MGDPTPHEPVVLLLAVITRYSEALAWTRERVEATWGRVGLVSPTFDFHETNYYEASMGPALGKTFLVCQTLRDPAEVADWKRLTNAWEIEYAQLGRHPEPRPLNLDPGYITPAKLVLASTKDHAHRMYLGQGMYAEVTLYYQHGHWQHHSFTFPDYRRVDYHAYFTTVRSELMRRRRKPLLP